MRDVMDLVVRLFLSIVFVGIPLCSDLLLRRFLGLSSLGAIPTVALYAPFFYLIKKTWQRPTPPKKENSFNNSAFSKQDPAAQKKSRFNRYVTFITCPGCGSLNPKGAKRCDCGYDFTASFCKIIRVFAISCICVVSLALSSYVGYIYGQTSMEPALEEQYQLGYDAGDSAGYERGLDLGHKYGYNNAYNDGYDAGYEDGYIKAIFPDAPRVKYLPIPNLLD